MPFRAVARLVNLSAHRAQAICRVYVDLAVAQADYSAVRHLAIDETSRARGHDYVTLAADSARRAVIFVSEGRDGQAIGSTGDSNNCLEWKAKPADALDAFLPLSDSNGVAIGLSQQKTFD